MRVNCLIHLVLFSIFSFFFFTHPATTEISSLSLHDALPIFAVLFRPASGKDGGHASRTVAEDRFEPFAIRREGTGEWVVLDDFPPAGVDKNEKRQNGFHGESLRRISPVDPVKPTAGFPGGAAWD